MNFFHRTLHVVALLALAWGAPALAANTPRQTIVRAILAENDAERIATIGSLVGESDPSIEVLLTAWKEDALFIFTAPDGAKIPVLLSGDNAPTRRLIDP